MSCSGGHLARPRQPVLPSLSTRTLHHPSFLPLYMAAGFAHHHTHSYNQTVHPIIPAEVFYTDPTMSCGRRIHNIVFDCFQLNTPPPVMSACLAPPNRRDPFRPGPHPTRDLGCPKWRMNPVHLPVQPNRAVLQLTQEEDQAITNLLKLHHQQPTQNVDTTHMDFPSAAGPPGDLNPCLFLIHPEPVDSSSAEEVNKPVCSDVQYPRRSGLGNHLQQGRSWSAVELEAADTLLSRFSLMQEDRIWGPCHQDSAVTLSDPPPCQHNMDLPISAKTQQESEALSTLKATHCAQNDISLTRFTCVSENREPIHEDFRSVEDRSASGDFSEMRERMLSDLEGDAVHVLLSLGDIGPLDIPQ
ncbi:uncharacterized protein [Trachinotus anak]|uniref:uncharacterized protein isoform X2 n=1 Tax=Trachinotus anak TaxID=443729 RepID=UPI0039F1D932